MGLKTLKTATVKELSDVIRVHHISRVLERGIFNDPERFATVAKVEEALHRGGTFRAALLQDPFCNASICLGFEIGAEAIRRLNDDLVLANAPEVWRCFHCNLVFDKEEEAREHFGTTEDQPECISTKHPLVVKLRERIKYLEEKLASQHGGEHLDPTKAKS